MHGCSGQVQRAADILQVCFPLVSSVRPLILRRYYTGEKVAPLPTIVIGGNHEASNYLWEL